MFCQVYFLGLGVSVLPTGKASTNEPMTHRYPEGNLAMNWDRMEGEWKQRRGKAVHHWGKMMNDELAAIAGKYEELVGRLQERYGIVSEKSKRRDNDFRRVVAQLKKSNANLVNLQAHLKHVESAPGKMKLGRVSRRKSRSRRGG